MYAQVGHHQQDADQRQRQPHQDEHAGPPWRGDTGQVSGALAYVATTSRGV